MDIDRKEELLREKLEKIDALEKEIKEREKLLQSAYKAAVNGTQLITDDGEIVPVPEYKQSEKSIKITFKK